MSNVSSFGSFTAARLGIYAAQKGLGVTGNNISNINTKGYTRQRIEQASLKTGGADAYAAKYDAHTGSGVLVTGMSQIRDPYLDIRYRSEWSSVGYSDHKLTGLQDIAAILDETGKGANKGDGLLFAGLSDFKKSLEQMSTDTSAESNDTLARASADTLVTLFRKYAEDLEELRTNAVTKLRQEVDKVNTLIAKIQELSTAIRKSDIHGDPALELRDERNVKIDELSEYVKVNVVYTMEDIGAGQQVEHLTISLADTNPDPAVTTDSTVLVDGIYGRELSMPETLPKENPDYNPDYTPGTTPPDPEVDLEAFKYLTEDGKGTNKASEAEQVENSNYDMVLSKLRDLQGKEWSKVLSSSVAKVATPAGAPEKAVYKFELSGDLKWEHPDTDQIVIDGTTYTIGKTGANNISPSTASDKNKLAAFIARELSKSDKYSDYDITTDGATIVFTAKKAGLVGDQGPKNKVELKLNNGGTNIKLTPDPANSDGVKADPDKFQYSRVESNDDGSKTITSYALRGTDWYETKIVCEYSQEVALDDNDLYGALQADREMLTEEGEFATGDTIQKIDENAAIKRGIPYYQKSLDLLARVFAETFNKANNGFAVDQNGNYLDPDGNVLELDDGPINQDLEKLTPDQKTALEARALTDFVKLNVTGMKHDGTLLGLDGEPLVLGDKALNANNLILNYDPTKPAADQTLAKALENAKGVDDNGNFVGEDGTTVILAYDNIKGIITDSTKPTDPTSGLDPDQKTALTDLEQMLDNYLQVEGDAMGGNLFSCRGDLDDGEGITASNITISHSWSTGAVHIVNSFTKLFGGDIQDTTQDKNVGHMITLMDAAQLYNPQDLVEDADSDHLFEGSFHEMMVKMCTVLGNDQSTVNTELNVHYDYAIEMDTSRDSVSAVDLNDEAMNMMQYSKALSAAYRLMTVLDESLERLINNTAI